jgi:hypothetical protein
MSTDVQEWERAVRTLIGRLKASPMPGDNAVIATPPGMAERTSIVRRAFSLHSESDVTAHE